MDRPDTPIPIGEEVRPEPNSVSDPQHQEPNVWDYFLSWFKRPSERIRLSDYSEPARLTVKPRRPTSEKSREFPTVRPGTIYRLPWRILTALLLGLIAQNLLEPPDQKPEPAVFFYVAAAAFTVWAIARREFRLEEIQPDSPDAPASQIHPFSFVTGLLLMIVSFLAFGGNRFTAMNLFFWIMAFLAMGIAFRGSNTRQKVTTWWRNLSDSVSLARWRIMVTPWSVLLFTVVAIVVFFRFFQLGQVPGEMFSDHAEKLLDVADVLSGERSIFFPRNTGREAFQMYLTAWIAEWFGTGLSFMSLKLGTALSGFLALPFIYLLGKEVGGRRVALIAFLLCGIAYWPNVISRVGLRFPIYALFTAPTLYFLIRGLRSGLLRHFILSGIFLGMGLHGYSPMRIVPIIIVLVAGIYFLHRQSAGKRWQTITAILVLALFALVVFLPLLRYMIDDPQMFVFRAFSRMGTTERDFPGNPGLIFLDNLWKAVIMFFWKNGEIWVHSIPGRPALDVVSAVLLFIGSVALFIRYLRERHWLDITLLALVPLLMLPSILSLSFPDENPSLNRTSAAIIPVFIISALALDALYRSLFLRATGRLGRWGATAFITFLTVWAMVQNYSLVFDRFKNQFLAGAWNTSQIGAVIRSFTDISGLPENAFVVPYPHWVDTRLVGINAGFPMRDYALWPEDFEETLHSDGQKLFILKVDDQENLTRLRQLYPASILYRYRNPWEGKDFLGLFTFQ